MLEVEAKLELMAPAVVRRALQAEGATPSGRRTEADTYYRHPVRDFAATDEALRVRRTDGAWELTYKGPKRGRDVKVREEHDRRMDDDPGPILEALGFRVFARISKDRESWDLDGVHVTLDTVDGLGSFAEVEVVGQDEAEATRRIEATIERLVLQGATRFDRSYLELALEAGVVAAEP